MIIIVIEENTSFLRDVAYILAYALKGAAVGVALFLGFPAVLAFIGLLVS